MRIKYGYLKGKIAESDYYNTEHEKVFKRIWENQEIKSNELVEELMDKDFIKNEGGEYKINYQKVD